MVPLEKLMIAPSIYFFRSIVTGFVLAFLLCALVLYLLLRTGWALRLAADVPNHRSLHAQPVPRAGGWGIVPVSVFLMFWAAPELRLLAAGALVLAAVSHFDDRYGLSAKLRFVVHFAVAAAVLLVFPPSPPSYWLIVVLTFCLVWLINLYNFMDGMDGLAGGMTFFGFLAYALAAGADHQLAYAAIILSGAATGFLVFNFSPARIFLGDAGSIPLGFLVGALGYWGWRAQIWAWWYPIMVFSPFIADASITLARRVARGERFWQAHREHYYQRMVLMGGSHAGTALRWYALMLCGAGLAWFALALPLAVQLSSFGIWILVLLICAWRVDRLWAKFIQSKASY